MTREELQKVFNEKMANDPEFKKAFESFMDKSAKVLSDSDLVNVGGGYSSDDYHNNRPCPDCGAKVHRDFLGYYCDDCGWHEFWWD